MNEVARALVYLRATSIWNSLLARLRRLRQPKYLIGAVVAIAYFYATLYAQFHRSTQEVQLPVGGAASWHLGVVGAALIMVFVALCWILPRERASLIFSEAEIAMLFPAPVRRRSLIHYRLISAQLATLFTALIASFIFRGASLAHSGAGFRIVGWWIVLSTLSLHFTASSFALSRLQDRGMTPVQRQLLSAGAIVLTLVLPVAWVGWRLHTSGSAAGTVPDLARSILALLEAPPLSWWLQPAQWLLEPMLSSDIGTFLRALGPAVLLFAAHYAWVLRGEVSFEEASLARAEKRTRQVAAARTGKLHFSNTEPKARRPAFTLRATGRVETAFLWKNLLATAPYLRLRPVMIVAASIGAVTLWLRASPERQALGTAVAIAVLAIAAYVLLLGPQLARQDLRQDLAAIDTLKTYPLPGWQIVAGELLTPVTVLSAVVWLMLLAGVLWFRPHDVAWLTPGLRFALATLLALLIPPLCALQLLVINAAVLFFPAWASTSQARGGGIEALGQRLLFFFGQFFITLLMLLPAGAAAAIFFFALRGLAGLPAAALVAAASALTVIATEVALGILWLGGRFERLDSSAELGP